MAGHSKWANIQHRKGAQDKKRSALFARLSKELTIASKLGGSDPDGNPRLRLAIANARGQSMPKDNIQRAIDKGQGAGGGEFEEIRYEGFGPGGVGIIVEVSTDNRNRAASEIRSSFSKGGGNLGETGSVSFGFSNVGEIVYPAEVGDEQVVMDVAIEVGASDIESDSQGHYIYAEREDFMDVVSGLSEHFKDIAPVSTKLIWKAENSIPVDGETAEKLLRLLERLDELDDVQNVFDNSDIPDAELTRILG